jgi:hypothetical protein
MFGGVLCRAGEKRKTENGVFYFREGVIGSIELGLIGLNQPRDKFDPSGYLLPATRYTLLIL